LPASGGAPSDTKRGLSCAVFTILPTVAWISRLSNSTLLLSSSACILSSSAFRRCSSLILLMSSSVAFIWFFSSLLNTQPPSASLNVAALETAEASDRDVLLESGSAPSETKRGLSCAVLTILPTAALRSTVLTPWGVEEPSRASCCLPRIRRATCSSLLCALSGVAYERIRIPGAVIPRSSGVGVGESTGSRITGRRRGETWVLKIGREAVRETTLRCSPWAGSGSVMKTDLLTLSMSTSVSTMRALPERTSDSRFAMSSTALIPITHLSRSSRDSAVNSNVFPSIALTCPPSLLCANTLSPSSTTWNSVSLSRYSALLIFGS